MKVSELRKMSVSELQKHLINSLTKKFKLRMQLSTKQLTNTCLVNENRKEIARIKTLITEKIGNSHE